MNGLNSETDSARQKASALLRRESCALVSETMTSEDGWRADFLCTEIEDQFALWVHKPNDAPYLCFGLILSMPHPRNAQELEEVLEQAASFDVSLSFGRGRRTSTHLAARLPLSALNESDLEFHLENLERCRLDILNWDEARSAAEEATAVSSEELGEGSESEIRP